MVEDDDADSGDDIVVASLGDVVGDALDGGDVGGADAMGQGQGA